MLEKWSVWLGRVLLHVGDKISCHLGVRSNFEWIWEILEKSVRCGEVNKKKSLLEFLLVSLAFLIGGRLNGTSEPN